MAKSIINEIHTKLTVEETAERIHKFRNWFYEFNFSNGVSTSVTDPLIQTIHETRADLVFPLLDNLFENKWREITCLDIACNQGWFSTQIALRGAKEVLGIDIRNEHIEMATQIKEIGDLNNAHFTCQNIFNVNTDHMGKYDITLFLGLLYHLENPMGALRKVKSMTKQVCVIETQVARSAPKLDILNGSDIYVKHGSGIGVFAADEHHVESDLSVVLVPTLDALYQMLYAVGFDRIYLAVPPRTMYQQYPDFDRVILFAQVL